MCIAHIYTKKVQFEKVHKICGDDESVDDNDDDDDAAVADADFYVLWLVDCH